MVIIKLLFAGVFAALVCFVVLSVAGIGNDETKDSGEVSDGTKKRRRDEDDGDYSQKSGSVDHKKVRPTNWK